jgi:hypothetical protein
MTPRPGQLAKVLCAAALSISTCLGLPSDPSLPKSDVLVRKFIQRWQEEDHENLDEKFGFIEHRLFDTLDKNGNVKEHSDETFQMVLLDGHPFLRLIAKHAKPLAAEERRKQADRENKFREEQHRKSEDKKDDRLKVDDLFLSHFQFEVVKREVLNGRPSYEVTVLPKPGNFSVRNNAEKIFTHMQGKVWVDAEDFTLVKCDLHLTEPTSFYGILGSVRQIDLALQRRWVEEKTWVFEKLCYTLDARRLFTSIHMRQDSEYSDFKKLGQ